MPCVTWEQASTQGEVVHGLHTARGFMPTRVWDGLAVCRGRFCLLVVVEEVMDDGCMVSYHPPLWKQLLLARPYESYESI